MRTPPRLMPALITPFTRTGEIDLEAHRHNLRTLSTAGIRGFLIGGSTGEGPYLEAGGENSCWTRRGMNWAGALSCCAGSPPDDAWRTAPGRGGGVGGADGLLVLSSHLAGEGESTS